MKFACNILIFLLALVCVGQLICFVNAMVGGREGRIYLMGTFYLSPLAILLCLVAGISLAFTPETVGYRNSYIWIVVAVFIGQVAMFCFG